MKGLRIALTLASIGLSAASAHAQPYPTQAYPSKPVTIVVTLAAGGAADVIARAVAQRLTEEWGQPVVVENKGGANNQVGTTAVARSAPDGYTLVLTPEHTFTVNPYLYRKLSYDPAKDFIPVTGLVSISQALVVHPSLAMQNVGRPDRSGQGEAGRDQLRQPGCRLGAASEHGAAAVDERDQAQRRAIQGRRARAHRRDRRPCPHDVREHGAGRAGVEGGPAASPRRRQPRTPGPVSRVADRRRDPAGLYRPRLVRSFRPKRNAAGHRRQDQQRGPAHSRGSRLP